MQKEFFTTSKIAFIHGRPSPHPFHEKLAKSIKSNFFLVDFLLRWHDKDTSKLYRYFSIILCSFLFSNSNKYKFLVSEGIHAIPVLAKRFTVFNNEYKAVALIDNETLFFIKSCFYSQKTSRRLINILKKFDALICVGNMQEQLANEILAGERNKPKIFKISSGVSEERLTEFKKVQPNLESEQIIFIANGPSGWRGWYKGIDILIDTIEIIREKLPEIKLKIVGEWEKNYIQELLKNRGDIKYHIHFVGKTSEIEKYLAQSALYVHIARGEAFGITIPEAMCAGLPCIVSEWTGAKELVEKVDKGCIVPLSAEKAAEQIIYYFNLPYKKKKYLSEKSREVVSEFSEERAIKEFQDVINKILVS